MDSEEADAERGRGIRERPGGQAGSRILVFCCARERKKGGGERCAHTEGSRKA